MIKDQTLTGLFETSIRDNWDHPSLSDYGGKTYTYHETGAQILKYQRIFEMCGVEKGDKIALLGKNSATWGMIYLASITYGAVIVPILPDFKPKDFHFIIQHSDSVLLFAEEALFKDLDMAQMPGLRLVLGIPDLKVHFIRNPECAGKIGPILAANIDVSKDDFTLVHSPTDHIGVISYTSGTTGFSKGVVLQHRSLLANIRYAHINMPLTNTDRILSFLPMAHAFGCTFEFLFPFTLGCHITFLNKIPSPTTIITAFGDVRPALILTVPLTIEKIYKNRIQPMIGKPAMKVLMHLPFIKRIIYKKIHQKLYALFGGRLKELVIGGAPFNHTVEKFFRKIGFPYTVGYGMTECGPLISYASWKTTRYGAAGRVVDELELKIDSEDPLNVPGEIFVRGSHVMLGYYKNEAATREVLDEDGWLHTGDIATIDKHRNIFIRGRSKSMLLGPSGQNIYPEELESILNNMPLIMESLVVQRDEQLVAMIFPDSESMEKAGVKEDQLPDIFKHYLHELNHHVPKYMRVADFEIRSAEFEKTPKRNPKRFLYS
jgi:long-chain acyl-CoA synthetase